MASHVCCIDDDPDARERTADSIERRLTDATVHTAPRPPEDANCCGNRSCDCIVSRYELPEGDGLTFLEDVRAIHPDVPFVLFTDAGSEAIASDAISAGVTDYVRKAGPDQYDRLAKRIEEAIASDAGSTAEPLLEAVDGSLLVCTPETGDVVDVYGMGADWWDRSPDAVVGRSVTDLFRPVPSATSVGTALERTLQDGTRRVEWRCDRPDGTTCRADVRLTRARIDGHERVVAHVRDATERSRRERNLETFREAIEQAGHSIYVTDPDGEILYVNPAFERLTGYSAEDAVGRTPSLLKSGEHGEAFYRELWETILEGDVWEREIVNEEASGERYVANQTIAPITDDGGEIVRFVAINADVTDRSRHERQLRVLSESLTSWLGASTPEQVCGLVGDRLTELPGFDVHAIYLLDGTDDTLEPVAVPDDAVGTDARLPTFERDGGIVGDVLASGEPRYLDDVHADLDGGDAVPGIRRGALLPLGDHGVLLLGTADPDGFSDADGFLANVLSSTLTAVLTRIEREADLRDQNARLTEFAHVVSHDLRNPLSVANGHLDLAIETGDETHLREVAQSHDRMERIIDDLLWLAEEGRRIGTTEPVDLGAVVEDAWTHVETDDATIETGCDRRLEADPDRLQQLLENLFRNAVDHGGPGVRVRVGPLEDGFYVADDGPGIPADERERVFESGYTTSANGTGYGLAIVRTIAEAHGWELEITDGFDGGVRFEVRGAG